MKTSRGPLALSLSLSLLALASAACDDVSPLDYRPPPPQDANVPDADPAEIAACQDCLIGEQGACHPQFVTCAAAHPLCEPLAGCVTESNCWRQLDLANIANLPPCMLRCYDEVGLASLNDIAGAATPVFVCLMTEPVCASACLGIGEDAGAN
jgi:hypothetical protein